VEDRKRRNFGLRHRFEEDTVGDLPKRDELEVGVVLVEAIVISRDLIRDIVERVGGIRAEAWTHQPLLHTLVFFFFLHVLLSLSLSRFFFSFNQLDYFVLFQEA